MSDMTIHGGSAITMTSIEMVDYINSQRDEDEAGLQHKHFCEKVPKVLGVERSAELLADLPDSYGRPRKGYKFPKREACLMAMSYSYDLQAKVFDKMTELEGNLLAPKFTIPASYSEALRFAADIQDQKDKADAALAIAAPKADAFDRISASPDTLTVTEASKVLGVKRKDLTARLHAEGWWYRQNSSWVAYDRYIKSGLLQYKEANYTDEKTGMSCAKAYCHITQKGLAKLALMLGMPINDSQMKLMA